MNVLIESTKDFELDLAELNQDEKAATVQTINTCVNLFSTQQADQYRKLRRLQLPLSIDGYDFSLYILEVSQGLTVILTVDEDPIFEQIIFTLFRVVEQDDLDRAYQNVAKSLYQDLLTHDRKTAQIS